MSSSASAYKESPSPASPEPASPVLSPRKRRRSSSADSTRSRKRTSNGLYNDAYRLLYNDFVQTTTGNSLGSPCKPSQLGASIWSASEKEAFFGALDRLGKDNLPGLAAAVRSKSILEIRQFLLLLQDAAFERAGKRGVSLEEIPAASEISVVCERQLEAAGDTLAMLQERFEAAQEQQRYGEHWLISADLANEIEVATKGTRASVPAESGDEGHLQDEANLSPILQEIPEARLLVPKTFLELSRNLFMNSSPNTSYPWPNWRDLVSELATEPCMYRTAFRDFHTLVLSVTKRVMQTALIQATSRIRSQSWRTSKGVKLFVRSRDVHTALDILGMKKSRRPYWRDVPRRCRLRVTDGKYRKLRSLRWDEVERILETVENMPTPLDSGTDTEGPISDAEQKEFKFRAARSGTPLPPPRQFRSEPSDEDNMDASNEDPGSDAYEHSAEAEETSEILATKDEESIYDSSEAEEQGLEDFDQEASRQEERKLWSIVGKMPGDDQASLGFKAEAEKRHHRIPRRAMKEERDDWRTWTQYHAEWEEYRTPIPTVNFTKNRKSPSPARVWEPATEYETDYATETGRSSGGERKSKKIRPTELPLRDARSYAALQGRQPRSVERDVESDAGEDNADVPAQSIEGAGQVDADAEDAMEWD